MNESVLFELGFQELFLSLNLIWIHDFLKLI